MFYILLFQKLTTMAPKGEKLKSGKDYKTRTVRVPTPDSPRLEWDLPRPEIQGPLRQRS